LSAGTKHLGVGTLGLVLAVTFIASVVALIRTLHDRPEDGRRPRLAAVVDGGKMEEYLDSETEKEVIFRWVDDGAPEKGWPEVEAILEERCVTCHFTGNERFDMLALDTYEEAALAAEVRPVLLEKITGGTMGKYLESRTERNALVGFIERGAPESEWPEARKILNAHCVACHNPEGVAGLPHLDVFPPVARLATLSEPSRPSLRRVALPVAGILVSVLGGLGLSRRRRRSSIS
jgi:hypothetical protein